MALSRLCCCCQARCERNNGGGINRTLDVNSKRFLCGSGPGLKNDSSLKKTHTCGVPMAPFNFLVKSARQTPNRITWSNGPRLSKPLPRVTNEIASLSEGMAGFARYLGIFLTVAVLWKLLCRHEIGVIIRPGI